MNKLMTLVVPLAAMLAACNLPTPDMAGPDASSDQSAPDASYVAADAGQIVAPPSGLLDSHVVCQGCTQELLAAKTAGILDAMEKVIAYAGADIRPAHALATFHLSDDGFCGAYAPGTTGFCSADAAGLAQFCLFDLEKQNRALAFTPENAAKAQDQLLAVHESMHGWFFDRVGNYGIEEPFCKMTSFVISENFGPDFCRFFTGSAYPDRLMTDLCALGLDAAKTGEVLHQVAAKADARNSALSASEFADIVSGVINADANPAFRAAGLIP